MSIPTPVIVAIAVVAVPFIVIFGALLIKIGWGFWPMASGIAGSAWAIWRLGIDYFFLAAVGIVAGIVLTWLWQRTRLFLAGDRLLEKGMMLGD